MIPQTRCAVTLLSDFTFFPSMHCSLKNDVATIIEESLLCIHWLDLYDCCCHCYL